MKFCYNLCFFQIDSHIKRLDEDLNNFSEDLKQGMIDAFGSTTLLLVIMPSEIWKAGTKIIRICMIRLGDYSIKSVDNLG